MLHARNSTARRVLDRIEIEHAHHGGTDNDKLPVTYDDLEAYGIHCHAIAPAIKEAVALGFIEITAQGRAGDAEQRAEPGPDLSQRQRQGGKRHA